MEHACAIDNAGGDSAAKHRFDSFRLGTGIPSSVVAQKRSHTRSHSRNASISSSISSLSFSTSSGSMSTKSTNSNDMSTFSFGTTNANPGNHPTLSSKRNSHHRRRSSVSTRCESAELMGVSVPDLPPLTSEDNINLGEKDSIRRRALWALEGKPDVSYSKVEIPELSTPEIEKKMFDFPTRPSFPPGSGASFATGLNTLIGNKRDSFKHLASSASAKDQLHTLVEEEEEEEDSGKQDSPLVDVEPIQVTPVVSAVAVVKPASSRPRPANLSLRPLSLTPDSLVSTIHGLPTPSLTPSPRPGLKSLSLTPSFPLTSSPIDDSTNTSMNALNSQSLVLTPSPTPSRPSLNIYCESPSLLPTSVGEAKPRRRSSISYKTSSTSSATGLPTPEMTPTSTERRVSGASSNSADENDFFPHPLQQSRPLSASEQHFLFKSHNALLARITDLERALSSRRRSESVYSRPASSCSDISLVSSSRGSVGGEPSDEMLQLIADLKAERDELKRDVDGWRARVGDLEKQIGVFAKRVETERREAWVARSKVGLLEVEKGTLEKALGVKSAEMAAEVEHLKGGNARLEAEREDANSRFRQLEEEYVRLRREIETEKRGREELERELEKADLLATPTPRAFDAVGTKPVTVLARRRGLGFTSVDSGSSGTDVELEPFDMPFGIGLKAVEEESEDVSEEENGLAGYEDEEDSDVNLQSPGGSMSSFGSEYDFPRSFTHERHDIPVVPITPSLSDTDSGTLTVRSRSPSPGSVPNVIAATPRPTHASKATLSKTWTFPKGIQVVSMTEREPDGVDRFFGCLEDLDAEQSPEIGAVPSEYTYEGSKGLFAKGFKYEDDIDGEMPPFLIPTDVGVETVETLRTLESVIEEEEEEEIKDQDQDQDISFREVGGIQITVTPADTETEVVTVESQPEQHVSPSFKKPVPVFEFFDDEEVTIPFNFGRKQTRPVKDISPPCATMITPPSSNPRVTSSSAAPTATPPSSIPRVMSSKPSFSIPEVLTSTPPKSPPIRFVSTSGYAANTFVTPPTKRGGTMPSFIPQPISSPSPMRSMVAPTKQKQGSNPNSTATFIRQPQRKPLMNTKNQNSSSALGTAQHVNLAMNTNSLRRSTDVSATPASSRPISEMKSVDLSDHSIPIPRNDYPKANVYSSRSSSFSSIISSPLSARLSFQKLMNFIPLWSPSTNPVGSTAAALCLIPESSCSSSTGSNDMQTGPRPEPGIAARVVKDVSVVQKRGYVSKEKQLEKLRSRLQRDSIVVRSTVDICRNCEDEAVFV